MTSKSHARRAVLVLAGSILSGAVSSVGSAGEGLARHWAFVSPSRPSLPEVGRPSWPRNAVDRFVLARLERDAIAPAPEADPATLLRRVTLDLTGLPPALSDVEAFIDDPGPDAYERAVERLLGSPRYGERMAARWLDGARYADTSGYQTDGERQMWRWRDWVLDALNGNMPYDRFTVEQIAGDLLPGSTLSQRIATGFNRNHRQNSEGGIIPEEYAVEYVVDRVDTTATVWLGLTLGCARCHDHKFDPITQREFYQVYAFFNNVPESGRAIKLGNSPPYIQAPTPRDTKRIADLDRKAVEAGEDFRKLEPELARAQAAWEESIGTGSSAGAGLEWSHMRGLTAHFPLDGDVTDRSSAPAGLVGDAARENEPHFSAGRLGLALDLHGKSCIEAAGAGAFGYLDKLSLAAWVHPEGPEGGTIVSRVAGEPTFDGYDIRLEGGKLQVNLVKRWLDDAIRVETRERLAGDRWQHILVTYDGSRVARGVAVYLDGRPVKLDVLLDELNQSFAVDQPFRIGARAADGYFHGRIDDVRVYKSALSPEEAEVLAAVEPVAGIARTPASRRTRGQASKLRSAFLDGPAPEHIRKARLRAELLREERERLAEGLPTTMVMSELPEPRSTFVLLRGEYDQRGERVAPGVPACLPPFPPGEPRNRLGLAKWLVEASNPLTARVAVNRWWQMFFGTGIVKSSEDFGAQGERPSHPELLDWLATELVRTGWDVKRLQRLIVTSAAYRQSSRARPELAGADPENRLIARGPRFRLPAEMIRDQALAASGLLVEKIGGPSVVTYLPAGLWKELGGADFIAGRGEDLYRRSIYTFWKRTVPPPSMMTFDAAGREMCSVREARTNTPLQALTLLNDVAFVEAARSLAERVLHEGDASPEARIALAFRLVMGRNPRPAELEILLDGLAYHRARFEGDPEAALRLASAGESARSGKARTGCASDVAAHAAVASLILNLDEAVTKE